MNFYIQKFYYCKTYCYWKLPMQVFKHGGFKSQGFCSGVNIPNICWKTLIDNTYIALCWSFRCATSAKWRCACGNNNPASYRIDTI